MKVAQLFLRAVRLLNPRPDEGELAPRLPEKMPRHVAIIMDGNGRWSQKRGLPRSAGHYAGMDAMIEIVRASDDWGVKALSVYAFSTENWGRPRDEVNALMQILVEYFTSQIDELHQKNVRIQVLGDLAALPDLQRETVENAIRRTAGNTGLVFNIALNYGGRAELVRAARKLVEQGLKPEEIDEAAFGRQLYTEGLPDVDLLIRTSGEMRTSNFLPWQTAYAEIIFNPVLWPDYTRQEYLQDLVRYAARDRRFGKV
jgi:undecaprenyl diphosphate synthase